MVVVAIVVVGEMVVAIDCCMGGNVVVGGSLITGPQADNANRATIIRFIVLPFS